MVGYTIADTLPIVKPTNINHNLQTKVKLHVELLITAMQADDCDPKGGIVLQGCKETKKLSINPVAIKLTITIIINEVFRICQLQ